MFTIECKMRRGLDLSRTWEMISSSMASSAAVFRFRAILFLALMALIIVPIMPPFSQAAAQGQGAGPGDEEYQIYSAAINDLLLSGNPRPMNISDQTEYPDFMDRLLKMNPPFSKGNALLENGTLKSFVAHNSRHYPLQRQFNLSTEYALVNEKSEPYATWIVGFSRAGLSPDGDQALLLLDNSAIWYVSEGMFVLLEKEDDIWRVKATELAYIGE
jgi:hypothetical protein